MGIVNARSITIQQTIDWPEFMSSQDMIWEVLPEYWHESAYLGNGRLGLMIYKEPEKNYIRFETSNCDVHDHREKRDVFGTPRLLTGHFALHPEGKSSVVRCASTLERRSYNRYCHYQRSDPFKNVCPCRRYDYDRKSNDRRRRKKLSVGMDCRRS